jgi:hypothetical protein
MIVGLSCATVAGLGKISLSRWTKIACAAFALYVAWSFLSVTWANDQGAAFLGSVRALVYLATFLTFAVLPWREWSAKVALGMLVAALGALALLTAIRLAALANPATLFLNARLSYPLGYYNADAAMFMVTAITAVALCSRQPVRPVLRVAGITIAAVCLQLAVLAQSRGWLFTAPIVLILALLLVPNRLRLLVAALGPAIATAAVAPTLLNLYDRATVGGVALAEPHLGGVLHREGSHAVHAMLAADAVLALVVALGVILDRRVSLGRRAQARIGRLSSAAAAVVVLAVVAAALAATHGHPLARAERAWNSFADVNNNANGSSRFTTLGSQRVDFWRVALHEFARHPVGGIGQDNFAAPYLRERHTGQEPRWTHSIELRLLTHTGLVGALLFALFLLAVLLASRAGPRKHHAERVSAAIALLPLVVWLVHGSIDWLWEFPALSVAALSFAGAATAVGSPRSLGTPEGGAGRDARKSSRRYPKRLLLPAWICAALLGVGALTALVIPFMASRKVEQALSVWPRHPGEAYAQLRSATALLPFDDQIYLLGGAIALNLEDFPAARHWLEETERHDHQSWLAPFALGLLEGEAGRTALARARLTRALGLNPREPAIALALARLAQGRPLSFAEAQQLLARRNQQRFGR